jgi:hypothetical protein
VCGLNAKLLLGAREGVMCMTETKPLAQICEGCDFRFFDKKKQDLCSLCRRADEAAELRPMCDCDQSGSGFSLCSYCFAEQVGGDA